MLEGILHFSRGYELRESESSENIIIEDVSILESTKIRFAARYEVAALVAGPSFGVITSEARPDISFFVAAGLSDNIYLQFSIQNAIGSYDSDPFRVLSVNYFFK